MWDMREAFPFGRLSTRNIFLFVASLVAIVFATLLIATTPVAADTDADITWQDGKILYDGNTYDGPTLSNDRAGYELPSETILYKYITGNTHRVIYFPADSKTSEATSAEFVTYKSNASGMLSDKSPTTTLSIDADSRSEAPSADTDDTTSSCEIVSIGYMVCPITMFLADGMDFIFDILKEFVEVTPLATGSDSSMRRAWDIMRSFANVAFVIAFIIIIYSQLTSIGMSNYGIKKLLPRIIIAAILVNVSYWICVIAIDASNILGNSLQGVFEGLRKMVDINNNAPVDWKDLAVFILSAGALGSVAAGGLVLGASSMGAITVGGLAFLLLPILVGAITTILVVVFILAARQALITILVIIAPLAFVAYLLPNTEKWFEKWRSIFITMMVFFPAFSVVFGGSQFAGAMIIDNAGTNLVLIILGMAVQIAPLAITPLLLKLSGTLLSRIGGIINDPARGFKDRTKNWSKERQEASRANQMRKNYNMAKAGKLKGRHIVRRSALNSDQRRRMREGEKTANETQATSLFNESKSGYALHKLQHATNIQKERVENELKTKIQSEVNIVGSKLHTDTLTLEAGKVKLEDTETEGKTMLQQNINELGSTLNTATRSLDVNKLLLEDEQVKTKRDVSKLMNADGSDMHRANVMLEADKAALKQAESVTERKLNEYRTNEHKNIPLDENVDVKTRKNMARLAFYHNETAMESSASQRAKEISDKEYATFIKENAYARARAGGIAGDKGQQRALSDAVKAASGHYNQGIENASAIVDAGNYTDAEIAGFSLNNSSGTDVIVNDDIRIAATRKTAGGGNAEQLIRFIRDTPDLKTLSDDLRQEGGDALLKNSSRPLFFGAGSAGAWKAGTITSVGTDRIDDMVFGAIADGKYTSSEGLVSQDKQFLRAAHESIARNSDLKNSAAIRRLTTGMDASSREAYIENIQGRMAEGLKQMHLMQHDNRLKSRIGNRDTDMGLLYNNMSGIVGDSVERKTYKEAQDNKPLPPKPTPIP